MNLLKRLFSAHYRRALQAEAAGDYVAAARGYALCGEQDKVTDMHLAHARRASTMEQRIDALRVALGSASLARHPQPRILVLLAQQLQKFAALQGLTTEVGRRSLSEAASLLDQAGQHEQAAEAYLQLGQQHKAVSLFGEAGLVDRVEQVLRADDAATDRARRLAAAEADYAILLQAGRRRQAMILLQQCIDLAQNKGTYRRTLDELRGKLLTRWEVLLQSDRGNWRLFGHAPLHIGRDVREGWTVRGPSVSRVHARIDYDEAAGSFTVQDQRSKAGTLLNGLSVGCSPVAIGVESTIGLGHETLLEVNEMTAQTSTPALLLHVAAGLDRGTRALLALGPLSIHDVFAEAPPMRLSFDAGIPRVEAPNSGPMRLNGYRVSGAIELVVGDTVEIEGASVSVCAHYGGTSV